MFNLPHDKLPSVHGCIGLFSSLWGNLIKGMQFHTAAHLECCGYPQFPTDND